LSWSRRVDYANSMRDTNPARWTSTTSICWLTSNYRTCHVGRASLFGEGSSRSARSVGRHGCMVAKDVAKPFKEKASGLGCSLRDMAQPEEAVDQPGILYVLHLDTHIT